LFTRNKTYWYERMLLVHWRCKALG